jgi:hypothetical protein
MTLQIKQSESPTIQAIEGAIVKAYAASFRTQSFHSCVDKDSFKNGIDTFISKFNIYIEQDNLEKLNQASN